LTSALIPREQYAALERCVYLNQASLGLVPRRSTEAMVDFLVDVAQYGNARLSDVAEERILDDLREAAAGLLDAPLRSVAVVAGASEALGQLAILTAQAGGEVVLVASDFPSVTAGRRQRGRAACARGRGACHRRRHADGGSDGGEPALMVC
jgi:selenocysteine lyase/cysteine desulfurase